MHGMIASIVEGQTKEALGYRKDSSDQDRHPCSDYPDGASGTDDDDLRKAMAAGINVVHINTELRVAWRRGLEEGLAKERQPPLST